MTPLGWLGCKILTQTNKVLLISTYNMFLKEWCLGKYYSYVSVKVCYRYSVEAPWWGAHILMPSVCFLWRHKKSMNKNGQKKAPCLEKCSVFSISVGEVAGFLQWKSYSVWVSIGLHWLLYFYSKMIVNECFFLCFFFFMRACWCAELHIFMMWRCQRNCPNWLFALC